MYTVIILTAFKRSEGTTPFFILPPLAIFISYISSSCNHEKLLFCKVTLDITRDTAVSNNPIFSSYLVLPYPNIIAHSIL